MWFGQQRQVRVTLALVNERHDCCRRRDFRGDQPTGRHRHQASKTLARQWRGTVLLRSQLRRIAIEFCGDILAGQ
jgi:hypothetical protein